MELIFPVDKVQKEMNYHFKYSNKNRIYHNQMILIPSIHGWVIIQKPFNVKKVKNENNHRRTSIELEMSFGKFHNKTFQLAINGKELTHSKKTNYQKISKLHHI